MEGGQAPRRGRLAAPLNLQGLSFLQPFLAAHAGLILRLELPLPFLRLPGSGVLAVCLSPESWTSKRPCWVFGGEVCVADHHGTPLTTSEKRSGSNHQPSDQKMTATLVVIITNDTLVVIFCLFFHCIILMCGGFHNTLLKFFYCCSKALLLSCMAMAHCHNTKT